MHIPVTHNMTLKTPHRVNIGCILQNAENETFRYIIYFLHNINNTLYIFTIIVVTAPIE